MDPSGLPGRATHLYPPRWRLLLWAATSALFVLLGYGLGRADYPVVSWVGWIMVVGLGAGTLVLITRAMRPGPTVTLDARGITDRTALVPAGLIRWDEIVVVRKREIGRGRGSERMLEVVLRDPAAFRARPRSLARRVVDAYRRIVKQPDVFIPGSMVSPSMQEVIDEIKRWRPEMVVLELPPPGPKMFARRQPGKPPSPPPW